MITIIKVREVSAAKGRGPGCLLRKEESSHFGRRKTEGGQQSRYLC